MRWRASPSVFISYRRDDAAVHARAIHDGLAAALGGEDHVFMDVADIPYGEAFLQIIRRTLAECEVVVAVIGPRWQTLAGPDGRPRLLAGDDTVRHEVASALGGGKRVIPVFVGGAAGFDQAALPPDLAPLAQLNGLTFTDRQLGEGVDRLVDAVRGRRSIDVVAEIVRRRMAHALGLGVALAMLFAAWVGLFDLLSLDTRTASYTIALADALAPVRPPGELRWVAIDGETERALGQPFRRNPAARLEHARLIRRLAEAGARSVAFDLFVVAPSPREDAALVAAVRDARRAGMVVIFGANRVEGSVPVMLPALRDAVSAWALLCYGQRLGYASTVPLATQRPGEPQARAIGLALAAASAGPALVTPAARQVVVSGAGGIRAYGYTELERLGDSQPCDAGSPGDAVATAMYRASPLEDLRSERHRVKLEDALAMPPAALRQRFQGTTVLVGLAMPDEDIHSTFHAWRVERRHGLELHADAAGALLQERIVQPVPWWGQFFVMLALGLVGSRLRLWAEGMPPWRRRLLLAAACAFCAAAAVVLCIAAGRLLNLTYQMGALLIGHALAGGLVRRRRLERGDPA